MDWAAGKKGTDKTKNDLRAELDQLAAELAGPSPTELVLAHNAAICWFACRLHEAQYADNVKSDEGIELAQSEHAQRRMD